MKEKYSIYGLFDPRDGRLRYVGYSVNPSRRLREHKSISKIKRHRSRNSNWCLCLFNLKMVPIMKIIETCDTPEYGAEREIFWIRYFKKKNCNLNNHTEGGNGLYGSVLSKHDRERISLSVKKYYKNNPDADKKMRERFHKNCHKSRPMSEKQKLRLKEVNSIPIRCNENGKVYPSSKVAAAELGVLCPNVCKVLKGLRKTTGGYTFSYIEKEG